MSGGVRVPYCNISEWNRAKLLCRSKKLSDLEECLDLLAMWKSRMGDEIPIALSCADLLVRVSIEEMKAGETYDSLVMERLKMLHCTTIIRFVNYLNEIHQPRDGHISIFDSVKRLGIPPWVVECRHSATHAHVPTITVLRKTTDFCANWLWDNFWTKSANEAMFTYGTSKDAADACTDQEANEARERVKKVISEYSQWKNANPNFDDTTIISKVNVPALFNLKQLILREPYDFLSVFVNDFLIMGPQQLDNYRIVVDESWTIPEQVQKFWLPICTLLDEQQLLAEFVITLLTSLKDAEPPYDIQRATWVKLILEPNVEAGVETFTMMDFRRILYKMLATTGYFKADLIEAILARVPKISDKRRRQIRRMMEITMSDSLLAVDDSMSVKTVADLQKMLKKDTRNKDPDSEGGAFQEADPEEWAAGTPIGMVPNKQNYENLSFQVESDLLNVWKTKFERKRKLNTILEDIVEVDSA